MNLYPLWMFVALLFAIFLGIPIAFSLTTVSIIFAYFLWGPNALNLLVTAAWGTMNNFVLIAIPLFIYMALILEKAKIVEDIYDAFYKWSGGLRGGLGVATILVGAILSACTGVVAAGVIGLGLIGLPQMLKNGYDRKLSMGAVMAGGTLGQLIPPTTNMIIYGSVTGVSIGALFAGGITCGLFLTFLYCVYILVRSYFNKDLCPALPEDKRADFITKVKAIKNIWQPALLVTIVLGSILMGAATPTEAAGVGAFGATLIGFSMKRVGWKEISEVSFTTLQISAMVSMIIIGASFFTGVFNGVGGTAMVTNAAMAMPGGRYAVLAAAMLFILIIGMFMEPTAIIMITAPVLSPILQRLGFDPLWWGLLFMVMLQVSYISPPFGFTIFYMKAVAPEDVTLSEIYVSALPYIGMQLIGLFFLTLFPDFVLWLPRLLF